MIAVLFVKVSHFRIKSFPKFFVLSYLLICSHPVALRTLALSRAYFGFHFADHVHFVIQFVFKNSCINWLLLVVVLANC
jgi:hypothetical protein